MVNFLFKVLIWVITYAILGFFYIAMSLAGFANIAAVGLVIYVGTLHILVFDFFNKPGDRNS